MGKPVHKHGFSLLMYFGEKVFCSCGGGNDVLYLVLCNLCVLKCTVDVDKIFLIICIEGSFSLCRAAAVVPPPRSSLWCVLEEWSGGSLLGSGPSVRKSKLCAKQV